jgi:hypothetical protein
VCVHARANYNHAAVGELSEEWLSKCWIPMLPSPLWIHLLHHWAETGSGTEPRPHTTGADFKKVRSRSVKVTDRSPQLMPISVHPRLLTLTGEVSVLQCIWVKGVWCERTYKTNTLSASPSRSWVGTAAFMATSHEPHGTAGHQNASTYSF